MPDVLGGGARHQHGADANELNRLQVVLTYLLPTLAVFGPLIAGVGPVFAFRILVPVYLLATFANIGRRSPGHVPLTRLALLTAWVWLVALLLLGLVRGLPDTGWTEMASVGFGLLLLLSVCLSPISRPVLMAWLRGWMIAVGSQIMVGFWEVLTGNHLPNYFTYVLDVPEWTTTDDVAGALGNPNNYAFFLVASLPLIVLSWQWSTRRFTQSVHAVLLASAVFLVARTDSRLSLAVLVVLLVIWLVTRNVFWRAVATFATLAMLIAVLTDSARLMQVLGLGAGSTQSLAGDASAQVRWNLIKNGLYFTGETSLVGLGPGGFEERMLGSAPFPTGGILSPHSGIIEILSQYGVLVFLLVAAVVFLTTLLSVRLMALTARTSKQRELAVALMISCVALPVLSFTSSSTLDLSFTWVYLAVLVLMGAVASDEILELRRA